MCRITTFLLLFLLLVTTGCETESSVREEVDADDARDDKQVTLISSSQLSETSSKERIATAEENIIGQWLDSNIKSQKRLVASRTGQSLSGSDIGIEVQISSAHNLLFEEQLNLLLEIKNSKNIAIARQYMLVHTLMTLDQAKHTQSILPANDPRHTGVIQQITTAKKLLAAIGYDKHLAEKSKSN